MLGKLNQAYELRLINNSALSEIGKRISSDCVHETPESPTRDGYKWFGSLEFPVDKERVRILFPWAQAFSNPSSKLDRSISVYSSGPILVGKVVNLVGRVAHELEQAHP